MTDKEIRKWLKISDAVSEIQREAEYPPAPEGLAGIFAAELARIFDTADCAVFLVDEEGANILAETGFHRPDRKRQYAADMPLMRYLAHSGKSIFIGNEQERLAVEGLLPGDDSESLICSPVVVRGKTRGFICLSSPRKEAFTGEDLKLVELISGVVSLMLEISFLSSEVESLTLRDKLTGCLKRKKFIEDMDIEIPCAERYGRPLSLLKIDIDSFKDFNDSNGRPCGDELLRKVGEVLSYSIRMCDKLYRYDGEEFIIILPGIDKERAVFTANRLQKVLGEFRLAGGAGGRTVTFSMGVASFPADAVYKDGLIKVVDSVLREAKKAGGDTVVSL